jgi:osmotically-inducible protein OsmY
MYWLDPERGNARRAKAGDRARSLYRKGARAVTRAANDAEARMEGLAAEARRAIDPGPVDDEKLTARVRARLGHLVRRPHAVTVEAADGKVILSGEIEAIESGKLLAAVMAVPGVKDVGNKLAMLGTGNAASGAGAWAGVAGGLLTYAGLRALKRAG